MKHIFENSDFTRYRVNDISKAKESITESAYFSRKTTIFISHKHSDLDKLKNIIGFLEKEFGVRVYIDSRDSSMPNITSGETAEKIKERIKLCDKFILFATDEAIESKWCNWELGYGDAINETKGNLALFPMKVSGTSDSSYKGNEYMSIYPCITYYDGTENYSNGNRIKQGFYIRKQKKDGSSVIEPLRNWLEV